MAIIIPGGGRGSKPGFQRTSSIFQEVVDLDRRRVDRIRTGCVVVNDVIELGIAIVVQPVNEIMAVVPPSGPMNAVHLGNAIADRLNQPPVPRESGHAVTSAAERSSSPAAAAEGA